MEGIAMLSPVIQKTAQMWPEISSTIFVPHTEAEYERAVLLLNELIDEVGEDENHPYASLMETVGALIENYETQHFPEPIGSPLGALALLMEEHRLQTIDLIELGNERSAEQILTGKQELTLPQIRALSKRFHVSPAVFV